MSLATESVTPTVSSMPNTFPRGELSRVVRLVALLNLGYFGVEFAVASTIGSVSLFADSVDFLEDALVNILIFAALGWGAIHRARLGMALAGVLLVPGIATLWTAWSKFNLPVPPAPVALTLAGSGALAVNLTCAFLRANHRHRGGSLTRAAFLSARNDAFANLAIIAAGLVTALVWRSAWPDLIVGLAIAAMNAGAAKEVREAAHEEHCGEIGNPCPSASHPPARTFADWALTPTSEPAAVAPLPGSPNRGARPPAVSMKLSGDLRPACLS